MAGCVGAGCVMFYALVQYGLPMSGCVGAGCVLFYAINNHLSTQHILEEHTIESHLIHYNNFMHINTYRLSSTTQVNMDALQETLKI
jgi:hypothetical protein